MIQKDNLIINADDFGLSPGVNYAILKMFLQKKLHSASLFVTTKYVEEAIKIIKANKDLKIGLHFSLTTGKSILGHEKLKTLTHLNGIFKYGFVGLFLMLLFSKKARLEAEEELVEQINLLKKNNIEIDHINGHRHIHFIPILFLICVKVAKKFNIPNIRIINESLFETIKIKKNISFSSLIKFCLLKFFYFINGSAQYKTDRYFFSILHTCEIDYDLIQKIKIPKKFKKVEIMIHPSDIEIDSKVIKEDFYGEESHLFSNNRKKEFFYD